ncbi:uncharacterized protein LOC111047821, partial [Nilaparvata lugens]|uniref:uncharacterized protein LOC111047821 n=1 Tax=Nilaparvata lugens TaxID=108931 RepID=UPI00193CC53E
MMGNISVDEQSRRASKSHSRFVKSASHRVSIFERRGLKGKTLFKCIARRAGQFREWLKEIDSYLIGVIRPAAGIAATKKTLPIEAKMILIKNEMLRTAAEQEDLEGFLGGLYFYNRYPEKEYKQLIGKTNCCAYGGGRTVLRQGHALSGQSRLYYVVTGNLSVEIETVDPITLASHVEVVKKLGPGDHFGDKAIVFNEDRESTVITLSDVMLLYITKEDFDAILKESLEKTWSQVRKATTELSYFFGDWTDAEIRRCSIISELITFQEGDLILGDGYGKRKNAHFIVEGQCSMIQDIEVEERGNGWKLVKSNDSENTNSDDSSKRRQHVYLQTNVFSKGACFGVGEKMNNRRYVAESDVQCLVVPQYLLIAHNRFETYKQFLESRLLSTEQLYSNFIYSRRRLEYKAKVLAMSKKAPPNTNFTTIWDVPHIFRLKEPQVGVCKIPDYISKKEQMAEMFKSIAAKVIAKQKEGRPPPKTIGQLMKEKVQQQREEVRQAIISFPYFITWPEDAYVEAAAISNIRDYKPDDIIHGYNREKSNYVYFVMEGIACVLQRLKIEAITDKAGKQKYKLIKDEREDTEDVVSHNQVNEQHPGNTNRERNVRDVFMELCVITKGECFGIGSELKNGRTVVAKTAVTCILIPRYVIYNNDYANMWSRIEQFLSSRMPNTQELFHKFVEG